MRKLLVPLLISLSIDAFAQKFDQSQVELLSGNAHQIAFNNGLSGGDWGELGKAIKDKKIISLGEFNHETWEVFKIKNDLIKYLHNEHGFNVILFESGLGEMINPNQRKKELSAIQMINGFFSYWRTEEFTELMDFIKKEDINFGGFDVQRFGGSFVNVLKDEARELAIDTVLFHNIEQRFGIVKDQLTSRNALYDSSKVETLQLIKDYRILLRKFPEEGSGNIGLVLQTLKNRIHYLDFRLQFLKDKDWNQRWLERDSMMAENVKFLIKSYYANEKIILYAHNFHIAKYNEKEEVMGEYLKDTFGEDMYSIGFFAGKGTYGDNRSLSPPDSIKLDIKHIIQQLEQGVHFIDIPESGFRGSNWLYNDLIVNDTFIDLSNSNTINLSKHFDGLILVDEIEAKK